MEIRLQKYIANSGVSSRRKAEELIVQGKIQVNGKIVTELGTKIDDQKDEVKFGGKILKPSNDKHIYVLLNKPIGYVSTVTDQFDRPTILDLVKIPGKRIVPCGRLDMYTSGAIILTDDGDFVYKLTHPKHEVDKTYTVTIIGVITNEEVQKLRDGLVIENDYKTRPAKVKILHIDEEQNRSRLAITIHEGKNRQVRKMCESIGRKVLALHRSKIGNIGVKDLKIGTWRYLTKKEIEIILGI